ncbi:unnamed protein product, partial [Allacma fusca]
APANAGRRRAYSGGYGSGGYTSGYSSGSSYAQQSTYSQQSGSDFGQLSHTQGQLQADSDEETQQDVDLVDYGDTDSIKFGADISGENKRSRTKWRTVSSSDASDLQALGSGTGSAYGQKEGWSSQSSWSSQSGAATQQAVSDSEVDSLLQGLQGEAKGTNLTKTGSLGPGHTYTYQRRVYNYTSGVGGVGGGSKPYVSCATRTCGSAFRYNQTRNLTGARNVHTQQSSQTHGTQGLVVGCSGVSCTQNQGQNLNQGSTSPGQVVGCSGVSCTQNQGQYLNQGSTTYVHQSSNLQSVNTGSVDESQNQLAGGVSTESRQPRATRQPPLYYQQSQHQGSQQIYQQSQSRETPTREYPQYPRETPIGEYPQYPRETPTREYPQYPRETPTRESPREYSQYPRETPTRESPREYPQQPRETPTRESRREYPQYPRETPTRESPREYPQYQRETPTRESPREYQSPSPTPGRPSRQEAAQTDVTCSNGVIKGQLITTAIGKEVYVFLGIPFARPPVGNLRFKRPEPVDNWDEPLIARTLPPACLQVNSSAFPDNPGEGQWNPASVSEDCLYLNIWVPANVFRSRDVQLSEVLFWIYGGGFFSGSASLDIYNGAVLASEKDIIVVSAQYRLGPLGFLYFNTPDAPGNVGLLDQIEALKWVNRNIQYFGGSRDEVTLMGESAGGASVSMHLISPLSRGLFNRAVLQSGVLSASWALKTPVEAEKNSLEIARLVGCDITKDKAEVIECLRNVDGTDITFNQFKLLKFLSFPFVPTTDGYSIPSCPLGMLEKSSVKRVDVLVGTNKDEGTYFLMYEYQRYLGNRANPQITYDKFLEMITGTVGTIHTAAETEAITNYYTNWKNPEDGNVNLQRLSDAVSDAYFVCPMREFADTWSKKGLNVYQYRFTHRTSTNPWPEWTGVMHSDELEYFFGAPLREPERFTVQEKQLSVHMMNLLASFVKTGVPSTRWQKYTEQRPTYVDLNADQITDEVAPTLGPRANECAFWTKILPAVTGFSSCSSRRDDTDTIALIERLSASICVSNDGNGAGTVKKNGGVSRTSRASSSKRTRLANIQNECQC